MRGKTNKFFFGGDREKGQNGRKVIPTMIWGQLRKDHGKGQKRVLQRVRLNVGLEKVILRTNGKTKF